MYDFVRELDEDLYLRLDDIRNAWVNHNSSIYSIIQSYAESLIKFLVKHQKKSSYLENRSNLGSMLDNSYVLSVLKHDLKISDKEFLQKINKTANTYKHERRIEFNEEQTRATIRDILEFSKRVYEYVYGKKLTLVFDDSFLVRENHEDFLVKIATATQDLAADNKIIIENEINRLEESKTQINDQLISLEQDSEDSEQYLSKDDLRSEIIELIQKQESIGGELGTQSQDYLKTSNDIRNLKKRLSDGSFEEYQSIDVKKKILGAVLNNNERVEVNLNRFNKQLTDAIEKSKDNPIHAYGLISERLTKSFDSNYVANGKFSIFGINDYNLGCKSIYRSFYAVVFNQLIKGTQIQPSMNLIDQDLEDQELSEVYMIQVLILNLIRNGVLDDIEWKLNVINRREYLLKLAIEDIFYRVENLTELAKIEFSKPKILIFSHSSEPQSVNISFDVHYPSRKRYYTINNSFDENRLVKLWFENRIEYSIDNDVSTSDKLAELLKLLFGFETFLPGQLPILVNVLNGNSTIGILTTGGGKSLVYQFAGLMQPKITLVIDPMNALIIDQHRKLTEDFNIQRVLMIISENTNKLTANENIDLFYDNPPLFAFASPERFQNARFRDLLISLNVSEIFGLIVLDEVHCLSEWGHDFRTSYLMLIHTINMYISKVKYLGLTATAALNVIRDLQVELDIFTPQDIIFSTRLQRENLFFHITEAQDSADMSNLLSGLLKEDHLQNSPFTFNKDTEEPGAQIVFFKTKKELERQYTRNLKLFPNEIAYFHGNHKENQDSFMKNEKTLLFSTNSFGMGIDKPNIRKTIHFGMPSSRENFFQEAGRSGRDSKMHFVIY
jgi:RecQ family ATP-dependent DNA helicase